MKLWIIAATALTACGTAGDSELVALKRQPDAKTIPPENSMGLFDAEGKWDYADMLGAQVNGRKAFHSFRKYLNARRSTCSGVLAYEPTGAASGQVYFYTARHCLQSRNPLGFRDGKDTFALSNVRRWIHPFTDSNVIVFEDISMSNGEMLRLSGKEGAMDIVRFPQNDKNPNYSNFLPVCQSDYANYHAVGAKSGTLFWADFKDTSVNSLLPTGVQQLLDLASAGNPYHVAGGVKTRAGDSGAPVFAVKLNAAEPRKVESYECVYGIINREIWVRRKCGDDCALKGRALFQKLYHGSRGTWQSFSYEAR